MAFTENTNLINRPILAGEFLRVTPKLNILDSGGNIVTLDSTSKAIVFIHDNPTGASIEPSNHVETISKNGVLTFSALKISLVGVDYRLSFTLYSYEPLTGRFTNTEIVLYSEKFNINNGLPRNLFVTVAAADAIAGGQSLGIQPQVVLRDYGDNVLTLDYETELHADLIESLSIAGSVAIDTITSPSTTSIVDVTCNLGTGSYGAGQDVIISVEFEYEVWLSNDGWDFPYLKLNVNPSGIERFAGFTGAMQKVYVLNFLYTSLAADSSVALDYFDVNSFFTNGTTIVDGNNRTVNTILPSSGFSQYSTITIDTVSPVITAISTSTADGEYGEGEVILFSITFDLPVTVVGVPEITLTNQAGSPIAYYNNTLTGDLVLEFRYDVGATDMSSSLSFSSGGSLIDLPSGANIYRKSENPVTTANPSFASATITAYVIAIDTTAPALDPSYGIVIVESADVYYPGQDIHFSVKFDKEVVISGIQVYLYLQTVSATPSTIGYGQFVSVDSDKKTAHFLYIVDDFAQTSQLDIYDSNSLVVSGDSYIRRDSTIPTMNANMDTSSYLTAISSVKTIQFESTELVVNSVSVQSATVALGGTDLKTDDYFLIDVVFSGRVTATCTPVFMVKAGIVRVAEYVSGNNTNTFTFKYIVQLNDQHVSGLYYRDGLSLCTEMDCPIPSYCFLRSESTNPITNINLILSVSGFTVQDGVLIDGSYTISGNVARTSVITSISTDTPAGNYGAGKIIYFDVKFNDEVFMTDFSPAGSVFPTLYLNTGKFANFSAGSSTNTWRFLYITEATDMETNLIPISIPGTSSPIKCDLADNCQLVNRYQTVDLTVTSQVVASNVQIDSSPPTITNIFTNKLTSPYANYYTVGEEILILVNFSYPVFVTVKVPRLLLDVGLVGDTRYAIYDQSLSTDSQFVFKYTVELGDSSEDLTYISGDLDRQELQTQMFRVSDIPTTEIDYTLPTPVSIGVGGNVVKIETILEAVITNVYSTNSARRYTVGDSIIIALDFNLHVILYSRAYITLNAGKFVANAIYVGTNINALDDSLPSPAVTTFYFRYTVRVDDFHADLDYTDPYSFNLGLDDLNNAGSLLRASTNPETNAILTLPVPGEIYSLSLNNDIYIDGSVVYMTSLKYLTSDGNYGLGQTISIEMKFSFDVVVTGLPGILLETGLYDRQAYYVSGSGTDTLIFEYIPQPGDITNSLDYVIDRAKLSTAKESYMLNGGSILSKSDVQSFAVEVNFNPKTGYLEGNKDTVAIAGVFDYKGLIIRSRGPDYMIRFTCIPKDANRTLTVSNEVFVSFSNEFQLRPVEAENNDLIGHDVSIFDDVSALGAPNSNVSVTTLQTITITGANAAPIEEVQIIRTRVEAQPAIQQFHSTADVNEVMGGFFRINYGRLGPTRQIPVNVDPLMLQAILAYDLPQLGKVIIERDPYIFCACENAFTWTLTFVDLVEGVVDALSFVGTDLVGNGASVEGPLRIQESAYLSGTFKLKAPLSGVVVESSPVPFDADMAQMKTAIAELGLVALTVQISPTDKTASRSWTVTFDAYNDWYDLPNLESDYSGLTGGVTSVWHETMRSGVHGPSGIMGEFSLEWRGNTTSRLNSSATAFEVKTALELLPVINYVNVVRSSPSFINGYIWTVEFVDVRKNTPRGYENQVVENVEPIIPHNYLIGTNTSIETGSRWNLGQKNDLFGVERRGTYGNKAGSVYVFQKQSDTWNQVKTLTGNDTTEYDQFGSSVSLVGDYILVGAIGADSNGLREKQSIYCSATNGSFSFSFRGWKSLAIPATATRQELIDSIVADPRDFAKLHSINYITVDDWGGGGLCTGDNTAMITFYSPVDGSVLLFGEDKKADLEDLLIVDNTLNGVVTVTEVEKGTIRPHGVESDIQQPGAAYLFKANYDCSSTTEQCVKDEWNQIAQFFPTNPTGFEQFGYSVALATGVSVVGAPGSDFGRGAVYVYSYRELTDEWGMLQKIINRDLLSGDRFGSAVAAQSNTIVIGAEFKTQATGGAYVYKRYDAGGSFIPVQTLLPDRRYYSLEVGDKFGHSIALDGNTLAVSSSEKDDSNIYFGTTVNGIEKDTGAVYVFVRESDILDFVFSQRLDPSNVRRLDRFGFDLALHNGNLMVGSLENFVGDLPAAKAIMEVKTVARYNARPVGNFFRLKWMVTNSTGKWGMRTTRKINYDITAANLKTVLEDDLDTGFLIVTRSLVDEYNNGYSWMITFVEQIDTVMLFESDKVDLTGKDADIVISFVNPSPPHKRGKTHIFQLDSVTGLFVEQMFLNPFVYQPIDRCGTSVAIYNNNGIVGCPNRDTTESNQNSGVGVIFNVDLLGLQFDQPTYTVSEDSDINVVVTKQSSALIEGDILLYIETVDRNADARQQKKIQNLYGINQGDIKFPLTVSDYCQYSGSGVARSQYYGSTHNESQWIDGMYDYRGVTDYVQIKTPNSFLLEFTNITATIVITDDTILETPDETVTIALHSPGLWPSLLGGLSTTLTITDNGDGFIYTSDFDKLYTPTLQEGASLGDAIAVDDELNVMFLGLPLEEASSFSEAGSVAYYRRVADTWVFQSSIYSPSPAEGAKFGDACIVNGILGRNASVLAIGEPGLNSVHIFLSHSIPPTDYSYNVTLTVPDAYLPQHRFGARGTIAHEGDIIVVGAPGLESIYLFTRYYDSSSMQFLWSAGTELKSLDYDFDIIRGSEFLHRQEFGKSVAMSGRTIVVGAPYADYSKLGSDLSEVDWFTEGTDIHGYARGKVYTFSSTPSQQTIYMQATAQLGRGEFRIEFDNFGEVTSTVPLAYSIGEADLAANLNDLTNIENVQVTRSEGLISEGGYFYTWIVTFATSWTTPLLLTPQWKFNGCDECAELEFNHTIPEETITVSQNVGIGLMTQHQALSPSDRRNGNKFGWSVDIDGDQIVVGAVHSSTMTTTTWDFESGTLVGWSSTGTAFQYQPTYGDNSYHRGVDPVLFPIPFLRTSSERSNLLGHYYIGTYEMRPGSPSDYSQPSVNYEPGEFQGEVPQGTLSSEVFVINGDKISFLIGGGCDSYLVYVELLVDGMSTSKVTGKCSETMRPVYFDTSFFHGKSGQIRIVDKSSIAWGHINVDQFTFDWDIQGGRFDDTADSVLTGGKMETPRTGAAYAYRRLLNKHVCLGDVFSCSWDEERKLMASDKRGNMFFGASVSVNDAAGVIVVGAPQASYTGFYKESPSVYPFQNSTGHSVTSDLSYPVRSNYMELFQGSNINNQESSGSFGVWYLMNLNEIYPDFKAYEYGGAVYVYTKKHAVINSGVIVNAQEWSITEHIKVQPPDEFARDNFGSTVNIDGKTLAIGSIGQDGQIEDGGAVYVYNAMFASLSFSKPEYPVLEGTDIEVTLTVQRNVDVFDGDINIEYATSDLTARGVDNTKFDACQNIPTNERGPSGCGDYEQTQGVLFIPKGSNSGGFKVKLMNDLCYERFLEYIQVTLSVPGSAALQGNSVVTKIRIDDDDYTSQPCLL
jgi:hypothetical protein